jgi:uncharacterized protein (DUF952 family)
MDAVRIRRVGVKDALKVGDLIVDCKSPALPGMPSGAGRKPPVQARPGWRGRCSPRSEVRSSAEWQGCHVTELLHITERVTWLEAAKTGEYRMSTRGMTLAEQGFIHCSLRHQLRAVAEYLYANADADQLVVLVIDSERVPAIVRYEAPEPGVEKYPHIYGVLPASAVTAVVAVSRDDAGRLVLPS